MFNFKFNVRTSKIFSFTNSKLKFSRKQKKNHSFQPTTNLALENELSEPYDFLADPSHDQAAQPEVDLSFCETEKFHPEQAIQMWNNTGQDLQAACFLNDEVNIGKRSF